MSRPIKGLNVLCKYDPDMFNKILGHEEYRIAIEETNGDKKKLKNVFCNVLADDYHWEFIKDEIVLRCGLTIKAARAKQNLQILIWEFVKKTKIGESFGSRCVCDFEDNFFSPHIIYYQNKETAYFNDETNLFSVPDFIVECNDENTEENNRGVKFEQYANKGVSEYWMVNIERKTIEQYFLNKGIFDFAGLIKAVKIKSGVIKNFEIDLEEIFET